MSRRQRRRPQRHSRAVPVWASYSAVIAGVLVVTFLATHPYVFLALGVAGACGAALWLSMETQKHRGRAAARLTVAEFRKLDPKGFEYAIARLCRRDGCRNVRVVGGAGDLGADVIATIPDGRRIVIQAKRYSPTNRVGSPEIQKVGGTYQVVHRAHLAAVVTTSSYTPAAVAYARQAGIRLYGEEQLAAWASRTGPAPWQ